MTEPIRDHGKIVTAPTGTSEDEVIDKLTGADKLPPIGQELGRAPSAPPFDPHEGREVAPGREFGDEPEAMISTMVFIGVDRGGDFEDALMRVIAVAEREGLIYVTATTGAFDIDKHLDGLTEIAEQVNHQEEEEDDGEDEEKPEERF